MGSAKHEMDRQEGLRQYALDVLLEAGNLQTCDGHEDAIFDKDGNDLTSAYKIANAGYSAGKVDQSFSRREMTDAIKSVYEDNSGLDECPYCAKNMRD